MKNSNRKQKTLDQVEIDRGIFFLPTELRSDYTKILHDVTVIDDRAGTSKQCVVIYHQVRELKRLFEKHNLKAGDTVGYAWEKDGLHLSFPKRSIFGFARKVNNIFFLLFALMLIASACGKKQPTMTPQTVEITGDLNGYFEVAQKEIVATEGRWSLWNVELKRTDKPFPWDEGMTMAKFNDTYTDGRAYCKIGFGLETFDKDGNALGKRSATATGLLGPYSSDDILDLMNLQSGETGIIRWDTDPTEDKTKGKLSFRITSAYEIVEGREQNKIVTTNDWDKVLDTYEDYVDRYIACMKKVAAGDMSAMTQYAKLLEKAEELDEQLESASGSMTAKQVSRYTRINNKMLEAAANGLN